MKKIPAVFTAVLTASVMAVSASSSALTVLSAENSVSETEICYEFENGKTDGGKIRQSVMSLFLPVVYELSYK